VSPPASLTPPSATFAPARSAPVRGPPARSWAGGTECAGRSLRGCSGISFEGGGFAPAFARAALGFALAGFGFAPAAFGFAPAAVCFAPAAFGLAGVGLAGLGLAGVAESARFSLRVPGRERGSRPRTPPSSFMRAV
jgi:hypothetical protein